MCSGQGFCGGRYRGPNRWLYGVKPIEGLQPATSRRSRPTAPARATTSPWSMPAGRGSVPSNQERATDHFADVADPDRRESHSHEATTIETGPHRQYGSAVTPPTQPCRPRTPEYDWRTYLAEFHRRRPGITAAVLEQSTNNQRTPYQWLVEQLPSHGPVVDVACGDAPLAAMLGARWIGIDRSPTELASGSARVDDGRMVLGEASALPFRSDCVDVAACSMALQILDPLDAVMTELRRIVGAGGRIGVLVPCRSPLSIRDRWRYLRLALIVRDRLSAPNDRRLVARSSNCHSLYATGLRATFDEQRRFTYRIAEPSDADRFVLSLYLPATSARRVSAARRLALRWVGTEIGIPIRLIVWKVDEGTGEQGTGHAPASSVRRRR